MKGGVYAGESGGFLRGKSDFAPRKVQVYSEESPSLSANRIVSPKTSTETETHPITIKSIRAKALTGVRPPRNKPTSSKGIDVRASTERLAIVG